MRLKVHLSITALLIATMVTVAALAQSSEKTSPTCSTGEHRQFDFWIGNWDVFGPNGKKLGENRIERISDGCALLENWTGGSGVTGKSLNIFDASDKLWHQFWVDSSGSTLLLEGKFSDGKMILASAKSAQQKTGASPLQKITWAPNNDGSVRQHWETSTDGGKTWTTAFDGKYVKKRG